jgi:hypothetical protein
MPRRGRLLAAIAIAAIVLPTSVEGQVRRGRTPPPTPPWAPITIGARGGWEQEQLANGGTLGAEIRIPVIRDGRFELVPSFDAIFVNPATEYQYNIDAAFVPAGRRGGVFVGGGVAWRESFIASVGTPSGRGTYFGYNLLLGGKTPLGPILAQVMVRFTLLSDTQFDPTSLTFGVSYPLWSSLPTPRP